MTETEQIIVGLISSAGQSKSLAFEALKKVKTGEYDEARKILNGQVFLLTNVILQV